MADPALGTKRVCGGCAKKFYDLGSDPIVCPTCETVFVIPKAPPPRNRGGFSPRSAYDPNSGPARSTGAPTQEAVPAIVDDIEAKDETEEAAEDETDDGTEDAGGVPMLEEIDEK